MRELGRSAGAQNVRVPVTTRIPGLVIVDHELQVPLDHRDPQGPQITVFAREVADPDGRDRPFLVYLQGGPGSEAPRPTRGGPAWLTQALKEFRVLLLDQRGTGRSTPIGSLPGLTPIEQAAYLRNFRADSIVRDAELLRAALGSPPWSVLGQSFGGFCALAYLSQAPQGLREALFTGGLPPVGGHIDDVYRATFATTLERNRRFYARYPGDRSRMLALHEWLEAEDVRLPNGDRLTSRRLRLAGAMLGGSDGAESLHYLLDLPPGSPAFLHDVEASTHFGRNPLYAILHESCWADGESTRWSAARMQPAEYESDPTLFTGEHVFGWMFTEFGALAPLREAADLLAAHDWDRLYDAEQLQANEVPCAAAIYAEDLYVERAFSEQTAHLVGGLRPWLTNEYEHNGLRADGGRILGRLIDLARGRI
jgi:pimeloyl-ACP methyl ester carboxylesterase